jgi:hypothetical protein
MENSFALFSLPGVDRVASESAFIFREMGKQIRKQLRDVTLIARKGLDNPVVKLCTTLFCFRFVQVNPIRVRNFKGEVAVIERPIASPATIPISVIFTEVLF